MSAGRRRERTFRGLLRLYPRGYRAEFGEEMCAVFSDALEDGPRRRPLAAFAWRMKEFGGLVAGAVRERLRALRPRPGVPGRPFLRGAFAFGVGFLLLIPVQMLLPLAGKLGRPFFAYPFDLSFFAQVGAFGCIGFFSAVVLGPILRMRGEGVRFRGMGSMASIAAGCAMGGALSSLLARVPWIALMQRRMPLFDAGMFCIDGIFLGCFIGLGFGIARGSARMALRTAGLGALAFGIGFTICCLIAFPVYLLARGPAGIGWNLLLKLSFTMGLGILSGGLFGRALLRGSRRERGTA